MQLVVKLNTFAVLFTILSLKNLQLALTDCTHEFNFISNNQSAQQDLPNNSAHSFLDDTKQCDDLLTAGLQVYNNETENCPDGLFAVNLAPHSVFPDGTNILPFIQLNISIAGNFSRIDQLFFQFRCVHAPNLEDYLCHKHSIQQQKWGRMIWPCRQLTNFLFHFSYTCYRLFSLSQYALDIFAINQDSVCRRGFLLTIPIERQLDPKIDHFYMGGSEGKLTNSHAKWSPLLFTDISSEDAVDVHFSPMEWLLPIRQMNISIFAHQEPDNDKYNGTKSILLLNERIFPTKIDNFNPLLDRRKKPKLFWRWTDVDPGNYTLYAFQDDGHCRLICLLDNNDCTLCPHTALNITIAEAKHSAELRQHLLIVAIGKRVALTIFVILTLSFSLLILAYLYVRIWRPRALSRQRPQSVELTNRPKLLVLYTDDCQVHCDVILELCRTLEESANAQCFLDQREFLDKPTLRPSVWLVEKLAECDFVLTIFSECSPRVLAGEQLVQRRHFPDHFNTAMGYVIARINEIASYEGVQLPRSQQKQNGLQNLKSLKTEKLYVENPTGQQSSTSSRFKRFIFARFVYSSPDCIPSFFTSSQFSQRGPLVLPEQIGPLIARLHNLTSDNYTAENESRFEHEANLNSLNAAIGNFNNFVRENPNWMEERFTKDKREIKDGESEVVLPGMSQSSPFRNIPNLAEQAEIAQKFGLLDADEEEQREGEANDTGHPRSSQSKTAAGKKYELLDDLKDFGSSHSSLDSVR